MQSGNRSGPVGSTDGQQAVYDGQVVREEQPDFAGHLQDGGHLEVRCRMTISPRSMAALWLCGFEKEPDHCGEICVTEVFGKDVVPGESAEVGVGLKQIRDPHLAQDFAAPRLPIDVAEFHTYAVDWDADEAVFSVDGEEVRRCPNPPTYPLQIMVAVFDFPEWSTGRRRPPGPRAGRRQDQRRRVSPRGSASERCAGRCMGRRRRSRGEPRRLTTTKSSDAS